jgi:hypothetical protein
MVEAIDPERDELVMEHRRQIFQRGVTRSRQGVELGPHARR